MRATRRRQPEQAGRCVGALTLMMRYASGLVLTTEVGTAVYPDSVKHHSVALQEAAGVPRMRLHNLRHPHVSLLIHQSIDARSIADWVGHSRTSIAMDVYAHLFDERRMAAVSLLNLLPRGDAATAN